jgi:GntR family transcriptional regulator, transcriptional repressor for pyruvate dehydrogenase complex
MNRISALNAVFKPIRPPTTVEETVERLGTAIRLGLLAPGTKLSPERELAEKLGISRSTLRLALTALVQSGYLVSRRGRGGGTLVTDQPPLASGRRLRPDWHEIFDQRVVVECGAALLAAERGERASWRRMARFVDRMDQSDDFETYRHADVRFHITIAEATGTPRLVATMTKVQDEMSELIGLIPHPKALLAHSNAEHRRILRALERGDGVATVRALRTHLEGTEHVIAGLIPRGAEEPGTEPSRQVVVRKSATEKALR